MRSENEPSEPASQLSQGRLLAAFVAFLAENAKWWLIPAVIVLGLVVALFILGSTGSRSFTYPVTSGDLPHPSSRLALLRELQREPFNPATVRRLARLGGDAVPHLLSILGDDTLPTVRAMASDTQVEIRIPLVKVRCAAVLGEMGDNAKSAVPVLLDLAGSADAIWLGNVLAALTALAPGCDLDAKTLDRLRDENLTAPRIRHRLSVTPTLLAPFGRSIGFVSLTPSVPVVRLCPDAILRQVSLLRRHPDMGDTGHLVDKVGNRKDLLMAEIACRAACRPSLRPTIARVRDAIHAALAGYYPDTQASEAEMWRDLAGKINPRYLDSLARAQIELSPDDCALGHVHFMQKGSAIRRESIIALRKLGREAAGALPWLLSVAKYAETELAKEAFGTLGMLGKTATPVRRELERVTTGSDELRARLARAAIVQIQRARE